MRVHPRSNHVGHRGTFLVAAAMASALVVAGTVGPAGADARINMTGSAEIAFAMRQWTAVGQAAGLEVNYTATNTPDGLNRYGGGQVDLAGVDAPGLYPPSAAADARGFQYVPALATSLSIVVHVQDTAGRAVTDLRLDRRTIAGIYTGTITSWSDPAIAADNPRTTLPDEPITVAYRGGESAATAHLFELIRRVAPDLFDPWAVRFGLGTGPINELPPGFAPKTQEGLSPYVRSPEGLWSIGYDDTGAADVYGATTALVENGDGNFVRADPTSISAALAAVDPGGDPAAALAALIDARGQGYPLATYLSILAPCTVTSELATCRGGFADPDKTTTTASLLRSIACQGQADVVALGYAPLPRAFTQEAAAAIGRLDGSAAPVLDASNCANPALLVVDDPFEPTTTPSTAATAADAVAIPAGASMAVTPAATAQVATPAFAG